MLGRAVRRRHRPFEQPAAESLGVLEPDATGALAAVGAGEEFAAGRVVQIDAELVGQHELDPAHHVLRARQLAHVDEAAAGGDRAPVDAAGIERLRPVGPVRENLQPLVSDDPRAAGGGIAGALADQVGRQVPVGIERGIADQPGHFWRRHGALADDDEHRVADSAVLDHPESGGRGVDEDVAALHGRDGAGALDIGEDQALVKGRAPVQRRDRGTVGAAGDRKAVDLLEDAHCRRRIGIARQAQPPAKLIRAVRGDLDLRQARPARAPGREAAGQAVIGGVAGQAGAGMRDRRIGRGEGIKRATGIGHGRGEAGIDIAHRIALGRAGAVAGRLEKGLAQHHVGAQPRIAVAGADRVERGDDIRPWRQQVQQGLVGTVGPDRLEVALGVEGEELGPGREGRHAGRRRSRAQRRGPGRGAVGRDGPEAEGEAGSAQETGQGSHAVENRRRRGRGPTVGQAGQRLCRTGAARRDSLSFAARPDMGAR